MPEDRNIDDEIAWWKQASIDQKHPELQMACWGIATGLKMSMADFLALAPQPKYRTIREPKS